MTSEADGLCNSIFSRSPSTMNPRAVVPADAFDYPMNGPKRGICLILNFTSFSVPDLKERTGSDEDRDALKRTFQKLGYKVIVENNLTRVKTLEAIRKVSAKNFSDKDSFVLCYLSHGDNHGVLYATDTYILYDEIFTLFTPEKGKCPSLAGKPKIFIFQACQGKETDAGVRLRARADGGGHTSPFQEYKIPSQADFFAAYSTPPGYTSYREESGSWFVTALVSELEAHWEYLDLASIMTHVCRKVAIEYQSNPMKDKQVPFCTTTLTRFVRFSRNNNNNNNGINAEDAPAGNNNCETARVEVETLIDTMESVRIDSDVTTEPETNNIGLTDNAEPTGSK